MGACFGDSFGASLGDGFDVGGPPNGDKTGPVVRGLNSEAAPGGDFVVDGDRTGPAVTTSDSSGGFSVGVFDLFSTVFWEAAVLPETGTFIEMVFSDSGGTVFSSRSHCLSGDTAGLIFSLWDSLLRFECVDCCAWEATTLDFSAVNGFSLTAF